MGSTKLRWPLNITGGKKRPKIKGCYQCARRRIDCDRGLPQCRKCDERGLKCDRSGINVRFCDGVASRGKLAGRHIPNILSYQTTPRESLKLFPQISETQDTSRQAEKETLSSSSWILLPDETPFSSAYERLSDVEREATISMSERGEQPSPTGIESCDYSRTDMESWTNGCHEDGANHLILRDNAVSSLREWSCDITTHENRRDISVGTTLDHLDGMTRWYLQYFANYVAPVTAVINSGFNGYRDVILPLAETDPLVRKAIVLVADQHASSNLGALSLIGLSDYVEVIHELTRRSSIMFPHEDETTLTTLLLLHLRQIMSGSDDFMLIYGSLRCLVMNSNYLNNLPDSPLGCFVKIQILRVCFFSESLLDEMNGAQFLSTQGYTCFEFLRFCMTFHPELEELMSNLSEMITVARDIYIQRAVYDPPITSALHQIEHFRRLTDRITPHFNIVGRHLLAWPYFVLAAESFLEEHRVFFLDRLESIHQNAGCENIKKAIQQLKHLWSVQGSVRWTSMLGGPNQALIM